MEYRPLHAIAHHLVSTLSNLSNLCRAMSGVRTIVVNSTAHSMHTKFFAGEAQFFDDEIVSKNGKLFFLVLSTKIDWLSFGGPQAGLQLFCNKQGYNLYPPYSM